MRAGKIMFIAIIFLIIGISFVSAAAIPVLEFNMSNIERKGMLAKLPHRYVPIENEISWREGETTFFNLTSLIILPEGEFAYSTNKLEGFNVKIDQDNGILELTPKQGWFGEEHIIVYVAGIGEGDVKLVDKTEENKLIFNTIGLSNLKTTFFDDFLFNMFSRKYFGIIGGSSGGRVNVTGELDKSNGVLILDVGNDVRILTSFAEESGRDKPVVEIKINSELIGFSSEVGHCGDDIRNYGELDVDCGGECLACSNVDGNYNMVFLLLISLGIIAIIYMLAKSGRLKISSKKKVKKNLVSSRDVMHGIASEIGALESEITGDNVDEVLEKLSRLVRGYFKALLHIKYSFTYHELNEELRNRKVSNYDKEKMLKMFSRINRAEYGDDNISRRELESMVIEAKKIIGKFELRE